MNASDVVLAFCGALTTVAGAVAVLWWLVRPRLEAWARRELVDPVRETHHQVTANSHASDSPTVLDRIDDVSTEVAGVHAEVVTVKGQLGEHITKAEVEHTKIWAAIGRLTAG
jgi:hypothetical protein